MSARAVHADDMGEQQLRVQPRGVRAAGGQPARSRAGSSSPTVKAGASLDPDGDGEVVDLAEDLGGGPAAPAMEQEVDLGLADAQLR